MVNRYYFMGYLLPDLVESFQYNDSDEDIKLSANYKKYIFDPDPNILANHLKNKATIYVEDDSEEEIIAILSNGHTIRITFSEPYVDESEDENASEEDKDETNKEEEEEIEEPVKEDTFERYKEPTTDSQKDEKKESRVFHIPFKKL